MQNYQKYLDPKVLNKISHLELKARMIVEGFIWGLHKSPYHGYSVEFAEHREYSPGDDIKHLDWKVFGRTDRLYLKQYEQETNLSSYILVDTSESMKYKSGPVSKFEYATYIASSLSYLTLQQQDAVGMFCFDKDVVKVVPARTNQVHMKAIVSTLAEAGNVNKTNMESTLHSIAGMIKKRGMIILISDLFDNPERILAGLQHFRYNKNDVIVFHVMDEFETEFPFKDMTKFLGLEGYPDILADPRSLRKAYVAEVEDFVTTIRRGCLKQQIDYVQVTTNQLLDVVLTTYLAKRLGRR